MAHLHDSISSSDDSDDDLRPYISSSGNTNTASSTAQRDTIQSHVETTTRVDSGVVFEIHDMTADGAAQVLSSSRPHDNDGEIRSCQDRRVIIFILVFTVFSLILHLMMYWAGFYTRSS